MHFLGRITYKQIYEETDLESHIRSNDNLRLKKNSLKITIMFQLLFKATAVKV